MITMIQQFLLQEMHGKEKEMLETEAQEKMAKRSSCLERAKEIRGQLKL